MIFAQEEQRQRLRWAFESCKNGAWGSEPDGENDVVCIRAADFHGQSGRLNDGERTLRTIEPEVLEKTALRPGDLVMEKSGGGEKQLVGRTVLFSDERPSICSNFLARCRPAKGVDSGYLNYLMLAIYVGRGTYPHIKQSTGIQNLDLSSYLNIRVNIPDLPIQQRIARFLDEKTAQIDGLIEKKRVLLDRLAEKRQALITRAVTKGLNPNAPMKPSGIDWLGDIPAHWSVVSLNKITKKITNGYVGPTRDIFVDDGIRYIQSLHIKNNRIIFGNDFFVEKSWSDQHSKSILNTDDVLIVQTGDIGQVAVVTPEYEGCNCHALILCSPIRGILSGRYLSWLLNSDYGQEFLQLVKTGALHPHLNCGNVKFFNVLIPPFEEQVQVADAIDVECEEITVMQGKIEDSLQKIKEYRSALITAAVTGQLPELNG